MSSLFGLLNLGANALQAQNAGVAVASNNVANANTPGYSRQRLDLESLIGAPLVGGVRVGGVDRLSSDLLAGRIRSNTSSFSVADAFAGALLDLEGAMSTQGADLGSLVAGFFAKVGEVSASPTDQGLRDATVAAASSLGTGMRQQAAAVTGAREQANQRIREKTVDANGLLRDIARANKTLTASNDPVVADQREQAAEQLSKLIGGTARIDPDGQMRVTLGGGQVLVDGMRAAQLISTRDPALGGMDRIEVVDGSHRSDVTGNIDGGAIGGELRMRDQAAVAAMAQLDQLAYDVTTQVNQVHQQNAGLDGTTGHALFAPVGQVAGAAAAMRVDPALLTDSRLLAAAAPGTGTGDNQGALALVALRDQPLAAGGTRTFIDAGIDVAAGVGRSAAEAVADRDFFGAQGDHLSGLRDSISGVSIQEEMTSLSQFQHASEAQVQFLHTVDELLGTIIEGL